MTGHRSVIGIFVLCALALCAFGASSASAAGRAFMCEGNTEAGKEQFSDAHCVVPAEGSGGFRHIPIVSVQAYVAANGKTAKETTAALPTKLKSTVSGIEVELECTTVGGEGTLSNSETSASGTGTFKYSGCTVTKPAGKGCLVTEGSFATATLALTTEGQASGTIKISPKSGTTFATVPISKCSNEALNKEFPVTGSVVTTANGATVTTTEAGVTAQGTLQFGGQKAGLEGAQTVSTPLGLFAFIDT